MLSRRLLRIKVIKALYAHFYTGVELSVSRKNLRYSIDKAYDLYFQMLWLIVEVRRYAERRAELGRRKHLPTPEELNPNTKFIDNEAIRRIEESDVVIDYLKKHKLGWTGYPHLIKELYEVFTASSEYSRYMASPAVPTFAADVEVVRAFYSLPAVEDNELLDSVLEEQSILWNDDLGFALVMVVRTLERMRERQCDVPVLDEFKGPEDPRFADQLFARAAGDYAENLTYIERFTVNWDVERIAFMDNLVMTTAIAELVGFPEIPVKVTLDEYIEIAKYYSTPGSNLFINGILDNVIALLTSEGKIAKQGRGLV
ncbi:MAG: transcription antitermination protein NusB [Rikenellaceae bacterium]|jgi:N utilization substance protein B|nr:transcription antitermination protein NusB [Rikenellaceae bacterium]